jgi:LysM repeat protein
LSNNTPDQYPYEPSEPRGRNPVYVIGAAALIVVLVLCVVIIVGVFAAGDLTDSDFVCDDRCLAATEISGTNFAISTQIGASQTAQSISQAGTATAEVALQATALPTSDHATPTDVGHVQPPSGDTTVYIVAEGDTIQRVAELFYVPVEELMNVNLLVESDALIPGEALVIPLYAAQFSFDPSPTAALTEIAAIPVRVVVIGEEIGIGTIRLFVPEEASYPELARVELELKLSQRIWTATPETDTSTGTESNDNPTPPPSIPTQAPPATQPPPGTSTPTPNFEEDGLTVFQKMGASLFCLESSFTGCDEDSNPVDAKIFTDLGRGLRWSWLIRPDQSITGRQDLQIVLWRVVVADDGPQEADVVWSHFFQIDANPGSIQSDSGGLSAPVIVGIAALGMALLLLVFFGRRTMRHQQKLRQTGPKVFISYRRHDTWAVARNLYDQLESRGARVFLDVKDINEGRFAEIIETNIERCEYFIPVLGPSTLESTWVRREIATAIAHNKVIIPILVSGFTFEAPLPDDIKELESHNSITLTPEYLDAAIARLLQFLHLNAP